MSGWGWPDEVNSWTFPGSEGHLLGIRVFSKVCKSAKLMLDDHVIDTAPFQANFTAVYALFIRSSFPLHPFSDAVPGMQKSAHTYIEYVRGTT